MGFCKKNTYFLLNLRWIYGGKNYSFLMGVCPKQFAFFYISLFMLCYDYTISGFSDLTNTTTVKVAMVSMSQ